MNHTQQVEPKGLPSNLWNLANFIRDRVAEAKAQSKLIQTSDTFVRRKIRKFEYKEGGDIALESSTEYIEKSEWHWKHQHDFIQETLRRAPTFEQCSEMLEKQFGGETGRKDHGLYEFAQKVASAAIGGLSDEGIVDLVSKLISDSNNAPTTIQVCVWAEGFWLKHGAPLLLSDLVLRRPTLDDLQTEQSITKAIHGHFAMDAAAVSPPAIVDFSIRASSEVNAQEEVLSLLNVLRLFRLGSVKDVRYSISPDSILRTGFASWFPLHFRALYRYALSSEDVELLNPFLQRVKPLVKVRFGQPEPEKEPADLAFLRYTDAVLAGGSIEARITAAISCLEALYLKGEERSELSHKLSLRVASLLRTLGLNPLEIQGRIHRAYEIRSAHIHGSQVDKERLKDGNDLCQKVLEYARLSATVFLQLKGKVDKDEFINKLDRALLEEKSLKRVGEHLAELIIPK